MKQPLVSVVISCYNYADFVGESISSVINQTYPNIELIVINDGSTDMSHEVINESKKTHKFRYIKNSNKGIIATRNQALKTIKGEYILQLDADDTLPKNYVTEMVKHASSTKSDITYSDFRTFGQLTEKSNFPQFSLEELKNHNFINISALLKVSAIRNLKFDKNLEGMTHEDWDFFLGLCLSGATAAKCNKTVLNYRIHGAGRNNTLSDEKDKIKYIKMFTYINSKYEKLYPEEFSYLIAPTFASWYTVLAERSETEISGLATALQVSRQRNEKLQKILNKMPAYLLARMSKRIVKRLNKSLRRK